MTNWRIWKTHWPYAAGVSILTHLQQNYARVRIVLDRQLWCPLSAVILTIILLYRILKIIIIIITSLTPFVLSNYKNTRSEGLHVNSKNDDFEVQYCFSAIHICIIVAGKLIVAIIWSAFYNFAYYSKNNKEYRKIVLQYNHENVKIMTYYNNVVLFHSIKYLKCLYSSR